MSRKLNLISLEHNCIPATFCCDDVSCGENIIRVGVRQRDSEMQSLSPVEPSSTTGKGELQQACASHCFKVANLHFLCMHDMGTHIRSNTGS